ncbi:MAG: Ig-like domain-containing protein [Lachnospiraceae bacterium]|nr:Ig-like domain-containing protein [Lachnospiraceae bacterium]
MRQSKIQKCIFTLGLVLLLSVFAPWTAKAVSAATQEAKLNVNAQSIVKGKTFSLVVYNRGEATVSYTSSDTDIATVSQNGVVKGISLGKATITATVKDSDGAKVNLTCTITVGTPATSVSFTKKTINLIVGERLMLDKIVLPLSTVENPKFYSLNSSVASVSAGGRVAARTEGSTLVYSLLDNGQFAVCKVNVYSLEEYTNTYGLTESESDYIASHPEVYSTGTADETSSDAPANE